MPVAERIRDRDERSDADRSRVESSRPGSERMASVSRQRCSGAAGRELERARVSRRTAVTESHSRRARFTAMLCWAKSVVNS